MKRNLLILTLLFSCQLWAADYYWVGGGGNWSDLNHWRLGSSAGSIPSIVPSSGDNVFFDANSGFTAGNKTVTLDANGFCNNMTWGNVANSPQFYTANVAFTVQISGSLSLSPTTTYYVIMAFKGAAPATLTTNGTVLGQFGVEIDKPGSSLTVTDSLIVPSTVNNGPNLILFTSGTFNIANKKVTVYSFSSDNNNVRTLEMTNANLTVNSGSNSGYHYTGTGKTLNAAGSTLTAFGYWADGGTYNKVTVTSGNGPNTIRVNNSTYSSLTFTPGVGVLYSHIGSNNIVDTLTFNGQGGIGYLISPNSAVGSNNTIGRVKFAMAAQIYGTGNMIGKIECLNTFQAYGNNINTVDSMILAPNRTTGFSGTFNINKYLYVAGAPCEALTEINGEPTAGTVNFAAGAVVDISYVLLTGVKATGPVTPIPVNGVDGGGNAGFTITEPSLVGSSHYWVGGSGDWNDRNHWSSTSGGPGGACVPFRNDNVIFDLNSGLTGGGTLTTSSGSFCNDMTWAAGVGTVTFNQSATSTFKIYGSLMLRPTVVMNATFEFTGSVPSSLTMNGGATTGTFQLYMAKTGSGSVTLMDNWSSPQGRIYHTQGTLNMAGRTVSMFQFYSRSNVSRTLDISNSTITVSNQWHYYGNSKLLTATGSHIISQGYFVSNATGSNYPWVDLNYAGVDASVFDISGTTFGQLTFTSASATSVARISGSNTIRRLEFKGAGNIIAGSNNIDSLILTGSRNYTFAGTNTINKYFKAEATPCSGLTEIRGNVANTTLAFQPAAEIHIGNVYLQNMRATGVMTPIAFNGADAGGNSGWTINSAPGSPRYWIGGAGDWNDNIHWSTTSGGVPGACVPTVYDDVYFDALSGFTAGNKTVTVNNGNAYCRNINWTGAANSPIWNKAASWSVEIWGDSIILNPAATFNVSAVTAKGANATFLKGAAPAGNFDMYIDKPGGSLTLLNNYNNSQTDFAVVNGAFNASGRTLNVASIDNLNLVNVTSMNISNATITTALWRYSNTVTNHSLNAANSSITANTIIAAGLQYDTVNVSGILNSSAIIASTTINRLTFTDPSTISAVGINGTSNTFGRVEYKGSGAIYGTGNIIDTLIFFPGNTYTLTAGTNTTINDAWYGSGTPCRATEIVSSSTTANATITKTSGDVDFDYVRLRRISAAGSASPFTARSHSTDLGNNTGWNIAPYDGAAPIYGLGPDVSTVLANFPMTLRTDGFFGSPSSQYTWNDNSTADTLEITGPGTYSVNVSFPDGCSISDEITVSLSPSLPVTLVSFTVKQVDCQSRLDWKVTDAINFSHFVIEKSADGYTYSKAASIPYTGVYNYSWTDPASDMQTSYYRLKMVDADATYSYSNTVSATNNCQVQAIKVFPTVTEDWVKVTMPAGYEQATIQVYNIWGQRLSPLITGSGTGRTVHLQNLPKATYVLQVINGTERKSFTIIKP